MKTLNYFFLPLLLFMFTACDKEEHSTVEEPEISEINMMTTSPLNEPQEIAVKIQKPTPCHTVEVETTTSGNTITYDILISPPNGEVACIQVVKEETVTVQFEPSASGTYTLNFLINGELQETREIVVTE